MNNKIDTINFDGVDYAIAPSSGNVTYSGSVAGASNVKSALDNLQSQVDVASTKEVTMLPIKLYILGDSIASDPQGIWRDFLNSRYNISTRNYSVGQAGWAHRRGSGNVSDVAGTTYSTDTSELVGTRTPDNVVTNQVNRLVEDIRAGRVEEPDVVLIHCGINDRSAQDNSWDDDADISMYGDVTELFKPLVLADEDVSGLTVNVDYKATDGCLLDMKGNNMDWAHAAALGIIKAYDVADANGKSTTVIDSRVKTMVGGMRFAIETLWMNYPAIKVCVTTPIYTTGRSYYNVRHINKAIKKAASYMSLPVIDLTYESQITPWRYSWQSCDGLHPDVRGAMYMAECIGAGLIRHFGFKKPLYKYDRKLTINVTDSGGNPVSGYSTMLAFNDLWMSTFQDGYKIKSADGVPYPGTTDSNGQIVCWIPARKYLVVHWNSSQSTQYILGEVDLASNSEATLDYVATDI